MKSFEIFNWNIVFLHRSYRHMTGEEIQLDRYAKFRKLGQFQEFAVRGGDWRKAITDRASVSPLA